MLQRCQTLHMKLGDGTGTVVMLWAGTELQQRAVGGKCCVATPMQTGEAGIYGEGYN